MLGLDPDFDFLQEPAVPKAKSVIRSHGPPAALPTEFHGAFSASPNRFDDTEQVFMALSNSDGTVIDPAHLHDVWR